MCMGFFVNQLGIICFGKKDFNNNKNINPELHHYIIYLCLSLFAHIKKQKGVGRNEQNTEVL